MVANVLPIEKEALRWPRVASEPGRFGAGAFRYGKREIGHVHHDHVADLPVAKEMREEPARRRPGVAARGRSEGLHKLPDRGPGGRLGGSGDPGL